MPSLVVKAINKSRMYDFINLNLTIFLYLVNNQEWPQHADVTGYLPELVKVARNHVLLTRVKTYKFKFKKNTIYKNNNVKYFRSSQLPWLQVCYTNINPTFKCSVDSFHISQIFVHVNILLNALKFTGCTVNAYHFA